MCLYVCMPLLASLVPTIHAVSVAHACRTLAICVCYLLPSRPEYTILPTPCYYWVINKLLDAYLALTHSCTSTQANTYIYTHKYFTITMHTYIYKDCLCSRAPFSHVSCSTFPVDDLDIAPTTRRLIILLPHLLPDITTESIYDSSRRFRDRLHTTGVWWQRLHLTLATSRIRVEWSSIQSSWVKLPYLYGFILSDWHFENVFINQMIRYATLPGKWVK